MAGSPVAGLSFYLYNATELDARIHTHTEREREKLTSLFDDLGGSGGTPVDGRYISSRFHPPEREGVREREVPIVRAAALDIGGW